MLGHSRTTDAGGEPWPVPLPGGSVISSRKIGEYLDEEFWHYYRVFANCEKFGLPHGGGWLDEPPWVIQLVSHFRDTVEQVRNWKMNKGK